MATETKRIRAVFETDTSKYNSSLNGINKQVKVYQSEVKAASADTKNFGKNSDALAKVQDGLNKQIDLSKQKIKLYEESMAKSNKKVEEGVSKRKELEKQLESNKAKYDEIIKAEGKNSEQAKSLKEEIDKLSEEYKKNEKSIESNIKKTADYQTNINNAKGSMSQLEDELNKTNKTLSEQSSRWKIASDKLEVYSEKAKKIGSGLNTLGNGILAFSIPAATGIGAATKQFMDFETQMAKVNTIADYTNISFESLKKGVIDLSKDTGVATSDLNEALYQAMSAGVDTADSVAFLGEAVKLAKGGFTSTTNAVDILTTVLNAYGLEASETKKVSDILVQTQNKGKTSVDELSSSLGKVIPTAKAANVNFEQLGAAVALMTSKGIATSESVTYLNSAINELSKSGTTASDALKEATGKTFQELMDSGKSLGDVMVDLETYSKNSGKSLADMFGSAEAGKAALTLATDGGKEFNDILKDMGESAGSTQKAYDEMMGTKSETLAIALNKTKLSFMKLGEAAIPIVDEIANLISELGDFIDGLSDEQIKSIVNFTKWGLIMGGTAKVAGGTMSAIGSLTGGLAKLTGKAAATTTATAGISGAMTTAATGTSFLTKAMGAGSLLLNPWTLGIAGVAAGAVVLGKTLSKDVVPEVDLFADSIQATGTVMSEYGEIATYESVKISDATKQNVQAYLDMEKGITDTLQSLYINSTVITEENANNLKSQFSSMGKSITEELTKDKENDLAILQNSFANSSALTEEEQAKIIEQLNGHYEAKNISVQEGEARIAEILNGASAANRELNKSERDEIEQIKINMRDTAIKCLSEQEVESQAILDRMASYDRRITAEMAAQHVTELNTARDTAVEKANEEYRNTLDIARRMKEDGSAESVALADKLIGEAERQRDEIIAAADKTRTEGIGKLEESYSNLREEVDVDSGEILSFWDKVKEKFLGMGGKTTYTVETEYVTKGQKYDGPPDYNGGNHKRRTNAVSMPIPNYSALTPQIMDRSLPKAEGFNYSRLEGMLDKFGNKIAGIDKNINVLINAKDLAQASGIYTDEELARRQTIASFGFA